MTTTEPERPKKEKSDKQLEDKRNDEEKLLFEAVKDRNIDHFQTILKENKNINVNSHDSDGMTALQHACFLKQKDMCDLLLAHGADVNINKHVYGYTTLMFAALSGHKEITQLILEHGGRVGTTNAVGRTASQMAAFTGQHEVVSIINNFFPKDELQYYTVPHDLETEARLPAELAGPLHRLIMNNNLNPVKISMLLQLCPALLERSTKVWRMMGFLCEKQMKQRETNEILAMKFHYISELIKQIEKWQSNNEDPKLDGWIKYLCRGRSEDGFADRQEQMVRSIIKSFPYQGQLLLQIVRVISSVKIGDQPTAVAALTQHINGQHMPGENEVECDTCADLCANKKCSKCKSVNYCQLACQKYHWPTHKKFCASLAEKHKKLAEEAARQEAEANKHTPSEKGDQNAETSELPVEDDTEITESSSATS